MIPPTLALSAASSALGLISSVASAATSGTSNGSTANGTSGTSSTSGTGSSTSSTSGTGDVNSIVNTGDFMKLLIAQLQNQDPLNPLDSANFASQLAQFSSLEQLTQINQTLTGQSQSKSFDAVSFIGRQVTGTSGTLAVKSGTATTLDYTLTQAGSVDATITDKNGQVVGALKLDGLGAGAHTFDLSQTANAPHLDDGIYTVALSQTDAASGTPTTIPTTMTGAVTGVDLTGASPVLLLGDRPLDVTNVTQIKDIAAGSGA